jgi:hypothetical protein
MSVVWAPYSQLRPFCLRQGGLQAIAAAQPAGRAESIDEHRHRPPYVHLHPVGQVNRYADTAPPRLPWSASEMRLPYQPRVGFGTRAGRHVIVLIRPPDVVQDAP